MIVSHVSGIFAVSLMHAQFNHYHIWLSNFCWKPRKLLSPAIPEKREIMLMVFHNSNFMLILRWIIIYENTLVHYGCLLSVHCMFTYCLYITTSAVHLFIIQDLSVFVSWSHRNHAFAGISSDTHSVQGGSKRDAMCIWYNFIIFRLHVSTWMVHHQGSLQ